MSPLTTNMELKILLCSAFDWESLSPGSVVVDVGGGIGASSFPLAEKFSEMNIVIQDLSNVIDEAKKVRGVPGTL